MSHEDRNALAKLIIYMCAVVVWALAGRDKALFKTAQEMGQMKWEEIQGGA